MAGGPRTGAVASRGREAFFDAAFGGRVPPTLGQLQVVLLTPSGEIVGSVESARSAS